MDRLLLLMHAGATLHMVGVIWFVQVVHYPLFAGVGPERFVDYEDRHTRRTTWVVLPPMVVELATAIWLVTADGLNPGGPGWLPMAGLVMVVLLWVITFAVSVPQHRRLAKGFDPRPHGWLVGTNWLRTALWSARGLLVLWLLTPPPPPEMVGGL
jgi:uncharacterized membrane protein